jgi:hypothetical protein
MARPIISTAIPFSFAHLDNYSFWFSGFCTSADTLTYATATNTLMDTSPVKKLDEEIGLGHAVPEEVEGDEEDPPT